MFSSLDQSNLGRQRTGVAFICGLLAESLVLGAVIFLGLMFPEELPVAYRQYAVAWLSPLNKPEPILKLPPKVPQVFIPKLKIPETPQITAPPVAELVVPKTRPVISPPSASLPEPPMPAPPTAQPPPTSKAQIAVNTGLFGGAPETVTTKRPASQVQTGGFGSPEGLPGRAQGDSPGNVPKLGAFGLPDGPGTGNGTGGRRGAVGVVASAGFGSGVAGSGAGGAGRPKVTTGGFATTALASPTPSGRPPVAPATVFQPVEVVSKPTPVYTEEARHLGVQGEVELSVVFQASGAIKVVGVVKSLGHGLDQAAEQAAAQIRFKPAERDGKPVDFPATLRIQFRLAGQSSSS